jgi:tetratricopeptide (TPR) repeat protein
MRRFGQLLGLVAVLAAAGGLGGWWYYTRQPDYQLRAGLAAVEHGDPVTAERLADRLEARGAKDHARLLRGRILIEQGKYDKALEDLNLIGDKGELRVEAVALCGRCHLELGQLDEAERDFRFVLNEQPQSVDANRGMAAVLYDMGALPTAKEFAEKWAELAPQDGRPHRFLGYIHKELGQQSQAISCYQRALQRDLSDRARQEVLLELAGTQVHLSLYSDALETLAACDANNAASYQALTFKAECLLVRGRKADGLALLDQALEVNPIFAHALRLRAKQYLEGKDYQASASLLEKAVAHDRHDFASRNLLAQAYTGLNRPADARIQRRLVAETQALVEKLDRVAQEIMSHPKNAELHKLMAELYLKLNQPEEARRSRRAAAIYGSVP